MDLFRFWRQDERTRRARRAAFEARVRDLL
jgi:hypothetical protein